MLARFLALTLAVELALYAVAGILLVHGANWTIGAAALAAVAVFLGWRLGITIVCFAIARLAARGPKCGPVALARIVIIETLAFALGYGVLQAMEPLLRRGLDRRTGRGTTVLLVHGYICNGAIWMWFARALRRRGYVARVVTLEPVLSGIDAQADALAAFIEREGLPDRFVVVAHSMGGLVTRAYVRRYGADRIERLITLGTPHRGTVLAPLGPGRVAREMALGSAWLADLWSDRSTLEAISGGVVTLYSADDDLVSPPESATLPGAKVIRLEAQSHVAMSFSPGVLREVLRVLPSV